MLLNLKTVLTMMAFNIDWESISINGRKGDTILIPKSYFWMREINILKYRYKRFTAKLQKFDKKFCHLTLIST